MLKIQAEKDHERHERYTFLQQKWHKLENTLQSDIHIRSSRTWMSIYFPLFLRLCDIRGLWSWQSEREKRGVRIPRWRTAYQMTLLVIRLCIWDAHIAIIPRVTTCLWWLVIGQAQHLIFFISDATSLMLQFQLIHMLKIRCIGLMTYMYLSLLQCLDKSSFVSPTARPTN